MDKQRQADIWWNQQHKREEHNKQTEPESSQINESSSNKSQLAFLLKFSVVWPFLGQECTSMKKKKSEYKKDYLKYKGKDSGEVKDRYTESIIYYKLQKGGRDIADRGIGLM